jgi:hypothetical protein
MQQSAHNPLARKLFFLAALPRGVREKSTDHSIFYLVPIPTAASSPQPALQIQPRRCWRQETTVDGRIRGGGRRRRAGRQSRAPGSMHACNCKRSRARRQAAAACRSRISREGENLPDPACAWTARRPRTAVFRCELGRRFGACACRNTVARFVF